MYRKFLLQARSYRYVKQLTCQTGQTRFKLLLRGNGGEYFSKFKKCIKSSIGFAKNLNTYTTVEIVQSTPAKIACNMFTTQYAASF